MDDLEQRFNHIYEKYNGLVWWYLNNNYIGTKADREDIAQQIWMGVWQHITTIPDDKIHAFLYRTIKNQISKAIYYSVRDKKTSTIEKEETSEGDHFDLLELIDTIDQMDDYSYFELMDTIQNTLDEEEFELFMYYIQDIPISKLRTKYHLSYQTIVDKYEVIKKKLSEAFEQDVKFDFLFKRVSGKKGKSYPFSEAHKKHLKEARKGYRHSEETKQKIREATKANWEKKKNNGS